MSGFYTFRWEHPATEVYVTGTFDNWGKSTKLEKTGSVFMKKVELPIQNIQYKFVVDGAWNIDRNAPIETDSSGFQNNILVAKNIEQDTKSPEPQDMFQAAISSVSPESTTAALAGAIPKEQDKISNGTTISSAAPDSTTAALAGAVPKEQDEITTFSSAAPDSTTSALAGQVPFEHPTTGNGAIPGGFPDTPVTEKGDQTFSIDPLPASDTAENPITLQPGEPVPKDIGTQTIHSHVKLDKESYENGASNYPLDSFTLPNVVTPYEQREAEGRGVLDLPKNLIPESSLPITSAAEAEAAKHAKVPDIVKESQEKTDVSAEASAVPEAVVNKADMESELKSEVAVKPPTAEGNTIIDQAKGVATDAATALSSTIAGVAVATGLTGNTAAPTNEPDSQVPEIVKDSIAEAGAPAEAAAVGASVRAKKEFESELKEEVDEVKSSTETPLDQASAPIADENAAKIASQTAPVVTNGIDTKTTVTHTIALNTKTTVTHTIALNKPVDSTPEPFKESVAEAGVSAEAGGDYVSVEHKDAVEEQPKKEVPPTEPIPATNGAQSTSEPATTAAPIEPVANGFSASKKSTEAATPTIASTKKSKRRSFFARFFQKLHFGRSEE
ncbi:hypothetical protein K440DRAFT_644909 [Wilcoxina mikolae CBS 423.85]|nr:hypothetical protein K440DRAFT_644909 [Wilcoxina mikolae CBS 423.85]